METKRKRVWRSSFAQNLKRQTGTNTVEQAIFMLVERKLSIMGNPSPPCNLSMMASICGIKSNFEYITMNHDGRLIINNDGCFIQVNTDHTEGRQRFSIAHEITHAVVAAGKVIQQYDCADIGSFAQKREEERLCDIGAQIMLLLTPKYLYPIVSDMGCTFAAISYIEDSFLVSFEAAARSIVETSNTPIAIVFVAPNLNKREQRQLYNQPLPFIEVHRPKEKLRVVRYYASSSFPMRINFNKSLPEDSCVVEAFLSDSKLQCREPLSFDNRNAYLVDVEAFPRTFYTDGVLTKGAVIMLSNPQAI